MVEKIQKCSYTTIKNSSCVQQTLSDLFLSDPQTQQDVHSVNTQVALSARLSVLMKRIENRWTIFSKFGAGDFRPRPM